MRRSIVFVLLIMILFLGCSATFAPSALNETDPVTNDPTNREDLLPYENMIKTTDEAGNEIYRKEDVEQGEEKEDMPKLISPPDGKPNINTES